MPKKKQFYMWLSKQPHRDDPIGDFAVDVQRDKTFPKTTNDLNRLDRHLTTRFSCSGAHEALSEAYAEFINKSKKEVKKWKI